VAPADRRIRNSWAHKVELGLADWTDDQMIAKTSDITAAPGDNQ
jgi:hypothetical protein